MTCPRRIVPGTTYLLTRRCTQRRFMFVPRGIVPKLFGYCVALAAERHGIELHAATCMSNHYHAVLTDPEGRVCEFARDVHSLTARALNAHLETGGHSDPGSLNKLESLARTSRPENRRSEKGACSS